VVVPTGRAPLVLPALELRRTRARDNRRLKRRGKRTASRLTAQAHTHRTRRLWRESTPRIGRLQRPRVTIRAAYTACDRQPRTVTSQSSLGSRGRPPGIHRSCTGLNAATFPTRLRITIFLSPSTCQIRDSETA